MPRTRTTFTKGQGGRKKGAKDRFPRSARRMVEALLEEFGSNVELLREVLLAGLTAKAPASFPYLRMVVEQHAGAPDQTVTVATKVVHELHPNVEVVHG